MHTVESKYMNPDKFIRELKAENKRLYEEANALYGEHQFSWTTMEEVERFIDSPTAHPFLLPGAGVRLEARVLEISRDNGGTTVKFELDECYLTKEA